MKNIYYIKKKSMQVVILFDLNTAHHHKVFKLTLTSRVYHNFGLHRHVSGYATIRYPHTHSAVYRMTVRVHPCIIVIIIIYVRPPPPRQNHHNI